MNTVGPYHNRQETYKYFSLPFCAGSKKTISHYHETLGEALQGVELEFSGLDIKFKGIPLLHWLSLVQHMRTDESTDITGVSESLGLFLSTHTIFLHLNKNYVVFMIPVDEVMQTTYCEIDLDKAKRDAFVYAIKNHYWYQMYIDDLPIWGKWYFISFKKTKKLASRLDGPLRRRYWTHVCVVSCAFMWSIVSVFSVSVYLCLPFCLGY